VLIFLKAQRRMCDPLLLTHLELAGSHIRLDAPQMRKNASCRQAWPSLQG